MRLRWIGIGSVAAASAIVLAVVWAASGFAEPPKPVSATEAQVTEFVNLHTRYETIIHDAQLTGDTALFPTIFYNDPGVDLSETAPDCLWLIQRYRTEVATLLQRAQAGPIGADTGILSCSVADNLFLHESVDAWETLKANAAREDRSPSLAELPDGLAPLERPTDEVPLNTTVYVLGAEIQGDHATIKYGFDESGSGWYEHMLLIRVGGQWYISAIWNSGNP